MKSIIFCILFIAGFFSAAAQKNEPMPESEARDMIEKFGGVRFNTDKAGMLIKRQDLINLLDSIKTDIVLIKFARTLQHDGDPEGDTKQKRLTLLLGVPKLGPFKKNAKIQEMFDFVNLTLFANLCPQPEDCEVN